MTSRSHFTARDTNTLIVLHRFKSSSSGLSSGLPSRRRHCLLSVCVCLSKLLSNETNWCWSSSNVIRGIWLRLMYSFVFVFFWFVLTWRLAWLPCWLLLKSSQNDGNPFGDILVVSTHGIRRAGIPETGLGAVFFPLSTRWEIGGALQCGRGFAGLGITLTWVWQHYGIIRVVLPIILSWCWHVFGMCCASCSTAKTAPQFTVWHNCMQWTNGVSPCQ